MQKVLRDLELFRRDSSVTDEEIDKRTGSLIAYFALRYDARLKIAISPKVGSSRNFEDIVVTNNYTSWMVYITTDKMQHG